MKPQRKECQKSSNGNHDITAYDGPRRYCTRCGWLPLEKQGDRSPEQDDKFQADVQRRLREQSEIFSTWDVFYAAVAIMVGAFIFWLVWHKIQVIVSLVGR